MIVKSVHTIPEVFKAMENQSIKLWKDKSIFNGDVIKLNGMRLRNFKQHGVDCVSCGAKGVFFRKEHEPKNGVWHLNLYALHKGGVVLMTRDHIIPLSLRGPNCLKNLQPMCAPCNTQKSSSLPKISQVPKRMHKTYDHIVHELYNYRRKHEICFSCKNSLPAI